jgi:hypothetical protein
MSVGADPDGSMSGFGLSSNIAQTGIPRVDFAVIQKYSLWIGALRGLLPVLFRSSKVYSDRCNVRVWDVFRKKMKTRGNLAGTDGRQRRTQ